MVIIDWILRITGLVSIIFSVISFLASRKEHISNVEVKFLGYDNNEPSESGLKYYEVFKDDTDNNEYTLFRPIGCEAKYLKVYDVQWNSKKNRLENGSCLATYKNIGHDKGVLLNIYYAEGIPSRKIEWKTDYGMKGEHYFGNNGFNGVVDVTCYKYRLGPISNVRRLLGLK